MSYNPSASSHQELVMKAYSLELGRVRQAKKLAEVKEKIDRAKLNAVDARDGLPPGMSLDVPHNSDDDGQETQDDAIPRRSTRPKTTKQRRKAAKLRKEVPRLSFCMRE
jgi:nucleolar protein 53